MHFLQDQGGRDEDDDDEDIDRRRCKVSGPLLVLGFISARFIH